MIPSDQVMIGTEQFSRRVETVSTTGTGGAVIDGIVAVDEFAPGHLGTTPVRQHRGSHPTVAAQ